jgi:hypothetical protein
MLDLHPGESGLLHLKNIHSGKPKLKPPFPFCHMDLITPPPIPFKFGRIPIGPARHFEHSSPVIALSPQKLPRARRMMIDNQTPPPVEDDSDNDNDDGVPWKGRFLRKPSDVFSTDMVYPCL